MSITGLEDAAKQLIWNTFLRPSRNRSSVRWSPLILKVIGPFFFDFLPIGLGKIKGFDIKVQVYTVPGQVQYRSTRKLVLKGVDGVIFVADSLAVRREKNMVSLKDLQHNLKEYGLNIFKIPLVMQHNKRDLAGQGFPIMSVEQMEKDLNRQLNVPSFPASAIIGQGVGATLKECLKLTLISFRQKLKLGH